jgi:hypothetical protein
MAGSFGGGVLSELCSTSSNVPAMCWSMSVLVSDVGMLWQYFSALRGLLDVAGETIRYVGYPGTSGEGVLFSVRFEYRIHTVIRSIEVVSICLGTSLHIGAAEVL